jgi:hypothetical protein
MLNKSMLPMLTAVLSIAVTQIGYSADEVPMKLQQTCKEAGAKYIDVSPTDPSVTVTNTTDLGNGMYDVWLNFGARQGVCTIDSEGKIHSLKAAGKASPYSE